MGHPIVQAADVAAQGRAPAHVGAPAPRGVLLVLIAGMLAILAALGSAFFTLMHMEMLSTVRYGDMVRADMLSKAGVQEGIARIREATFIKMEDPTDTWYTADCLRGGKRKISFGYGDGLDNDSDGIVDNEPAEVHKPFTRALSSTVGKESDRYVLEIEDASSKINVNGTENLAAVLDNLCRLIGAPLAAADQDLLQSYCWYEYSGNTLTSYSYNTQDQKENRDLYFAVDKKGRPVQKNQSPYQVMIGGLGKAVDGTAVFGDGYAIAGFRGRHGPFRSLDQIKQALTFVDRNGSGVLDDPLETLEVEVKFAALKPYVTLDSWRDPTTVSVGKFEWITGTRAGLYDIAIDRDKSWVADDLLNDPFNERGSLRGCYLSILNGHGAGQLRRIKTNGVDWVQIETFDDPQKPGYETGFVIPPGPITSYMIVAPEDAKLVDMDGNDLPYNYVNKPPAPGTQTFPKTDAAGNFVDEPLIDYYSRPLCIHRAPVNVNTAPDKVLAALFLGINVQQGHHLSIGTLADLEGTRLQWKQVDPAGLEPYLLTAQGLKRVPVVPGKAVLNTDLPTLPPEAVAQGYDLAYVNSYGGHGAPEFEVVPAKTTNEAEELAYRIIIAREPDRNLPFLDPGTGNPVPAGGTCTEPGSGVSFAAGNPAYQRGPFKSWDDFYFRVVRPWDEKRLREGWTDVNGNGMMDYWVDLNADQVVQPNEVDTYRNAARGRMIMAHFNSNTDILKFNPNIEWIDRWGRNFSEMEPVHIYPDVDPLPNNVLPIYVQYGTFWTGVTHWSHNYDWCPALLADYDALRAGAYIIRAFRYKSDEMIDKTDMNRSTTEFTFHSNGIFEINSTGQVANITTGQLLAERKTQALVKVYDVWRETTQRQFAQGTIEVGPRTGRIGPTGSNHSGQVVRDAKNGFFGIVDRLPLNTLPEPLVPPQYRLNKQDAFRNEPVNHFVAAGVPFVDNIDVVDTTLPRAMKRNGFGNIVDMDLPAAVANKIQPAGYDGQVVLATNTSHFDPRGVERPGTGQGEALMQDPGRDGDSFLATFDGDTDTVTCNGNGHEQAKMPRTYNFDGYKFPVVDCTGLLGVMNDTLWDQDPMVNPLDPKVSLEDKKRSIPNTYMWGYGGLGNESVIGGALRGLNKDHFWENALVRMGDLRTDGVFLTSPGVSGNDATLKYLIGDPDRLQSVADDRLNPSAPGFPGSGPSIKNRANFDIQQSMTTIPSGPNQGMGGADVGEGFLLSMWFKSTWRQDDNRSHEFFNACNPGHYLSARGFVFQKYGRYAYANWGDGGGFSGCARRKNDLYWGMEGEHRDILDRDNVIQLHGGSNRVAYSGVPSHEESPGYRVQPFRWQFTGVRLNYGSFHRLRNAYVQSGHWYRSGGFDDNLKCLINYHSRPFMSTQTFPEDDVFNWLSTPAADNAATASGAPTSIWQWHYGATLGRYYMYQVNTLINSCHFARAPDIGRSFGPQRLPTKIRNPDTGGDWKDATDDKGNSAMSGKPDVDGSKGADYGGRTAQDVRWDWADPGTMEASEIPGNPGVAGRRKNYWPRGSTRAIPKSFGINNLNFGESDDGNNSNDAWIYRPMPEDGTYAVIDELKISKKERTMAVPDPWTPVVRKRDRITGEGGIDFGLARNNRGDVRGGEMRTSRYYFPPNADDPLSCPTFTSQPLFKSLKGAVLASAEQVTVARVTWTVFTPRFMAENKFADDQNYRRNEWFSEKDYGDRGVGNQVAHLLPYQGPFDWVRYNKDIYNFQEGLDVAPPVFPRPPETNTRVAGSKDRYFSVRRPCPADYLAKGLTQPHATQGVEVELVKGNASPYTPLDQATIAEYTPGGALVITPARGGVTFTDPDKINRYGDITNASRVKASELRYRVRFRYPRDPLVDAKGVSAVDFRTQYLLDTPVFDDISVTYFTKPRVLSYKEVLE